MSSLRPSLYAVCPSDWPELSLTAGRSGRRIPNTGDFWEPVYHAVLANGVVYDPGFGGSIFKLNKSNGAAITRLIPAQFLHPDGSLDAHTYTVSPLTADSSGNIYYNVLKIHDNGIFYSMDAVDSWL